MKKIIALVLCIITVFALASCGAAKTEDKDEFNVNSLKTLGEVFKLEREDLGWSYDDKNFVTAFEYGEIAYRVIAGLTENIYNELEAIDFFDAERDAKIEATLENVKITKTENLTQYIPTEADLQKYVGKTAKDLFDEDFWERGYFLLGEQVFYMGHDMFEYEVYFNEKLEADTMADDFDLEEAIADFTVKKIKFSGFSSAVTDID